MPCRTHQQPMYRTTTHFHRTGHLLAWTEPARVRPESSSSTSSITVTGPGTAFLRSHIPSAYRRWAVPALPQLQAAVADAAAKATSAAAATAGGKRRPEDGGEQAAELPVMLRREGLGKRLRRRVWRCVVECVHGCVRCSFYSSIHLHHHIPYTHTEQASSRVPQRPAARGRRAGGANAADARSRRPEGCAAKPAPPP